MVVGGVFGGLALGVKSTLDDACDANKGCPQSSSGDLDDLALFSHASTGLFVAGGVVAAAGAVMLGIGAATNGRSTEARVRPIVGLGFIGVGGTL